jgi:hypothetical protein
MSFATIRLEPQGNDCVVILLAADGRELARDTLTKATLGDGKWKVNLDAVEPPPAGDIVQRVSNAKPEQRDHNDYMEIAQTLYDWLFPAGQVRQAWDKLNNRNPKPKLYVDAAVDAMARLPWELARARLPDRRPALINGLHRLCQSPDMPAASSAWPFRILIAVGCTEEEESKDKLDIAEEVKAIKRGFLKLGRSVDVNCLRRPTKKALMDCIETYHPHVLHFAGHGTKAPGADKFGLRFESAEGFWPWYSSDIDTDVQTMGWVPQFVFLNACRSAIELRGNWSLQQSFLGAGAKAVLGMQADTRGDLSGAFAAALYAKLAEGGTLEDALAKARAAVTREPLLVPSLDHIDWALPSLMVTGRDTVLFRPRPWPADPSFEQCREFEAARHFADCKDGRRTLTHWIYPTIETIKPNVLLLEGAPGCGKSHLLKWCMENWAIGGARVRYVELRDSKPKDFLSVLRQIRDGEAVAGNEDTLYLHSELDPLKFRRFTWELNNLNQTGVVGDWDAAAVPAGKVADDNLALAARGEKAPHPIVGASFVAALREAAAVASPLVLVLDNFPGLLSPGECELLVRHVFRPIAEDADSQVKVVFGVTSAQVVEYKLSLLPAPKTMKYAIPDQFSDDQLIQLASELVWFQDESNVQDVATWVLSRPRPPNLTGLGLLSKVHQTIRAASPDLLEAVVRMR